MLWSFDRYVLLMSGVRYAEHPASGLIEAQGVFEIPGFRDFGNIGGGFSRKSVRLSFALDDHISRSPHDRVGKTLRHTRPWRARLTA